MRAMSLLVEIGRFGQFGVQAKSDNTAPLLQRFDLVGFDADKRVLSHPLDLPTERRETVEVVSVPRDANGHYVGLSFRRAAEPREVPGSEERKTLFPGQFMDQ